MKRSGYLVIGLGMATVAMMVAANGQSIGKADTPLKVAEVLNCLVQPRFQTFDDKFGMSRLLRVSGHDAVQLAADTPQEKKYLETGKAGNRDYVVTFLHCAHTPSSMVRYGKKVNPMPEVVAARYKPDSDKPDLRFVSGRGNDAYRTWTQNQHAWDSGAIAELARLKRGEDVNVDQQNWLLAMRPVKASKQECLGCHTKSKMGDTLGVMVYAVSKKTLDTKVTGRATL